MSFKISSLLQDAFSSSDLKNKALLISPDGKYEGTANQYYTTQNGAITPACIVQPDSVEDVQKAIRIISKLNETTKVPFAVRSGGTHTNTTTANVDNGVTIDLRKLNQITISKDKKHVTVGPGAKWTDVYDHLEKEGLVVPGTRSAIAGLGGMILGGGISFLSPKVGFICDSVTEYEFIQADGTLLHVTQSTHPDLFLALRGGGNNFGIVLAFTIATYLTSPLWHGVYIHDINTAHDQHVALEAFTTAGSDTDENATIIQAIGYAEGQGRFFINNMVYTAPVTTSPAAFEKFTSIPSLVQHVQDKSNMSGAAHSIAASTPTNMHGMYVTATMRPTVEMMDFATNKAHEIMARAETAPGILWAFVFQPLPTAITSKSAARGGNSLGLDGKQDLLLYEISVNWARAEDEELVSNATLELFDVIEKESKERGCYHPWQYLNYAHPSQDPLAGYGEANMERFVSVSKKYDPEGLFQWGCPGGFKLSGRAEEFEHRKV